MIYKLSTGVVKPSHMHHIKQILVIGSIIGLILTICMYLVLLQAEMDIRLDGTPMTTEPERIKPLHE